MITIARLTIHEAARRRILWVLLALTLVTVGLTSWGTAALANLARGGGTGELEIRIGVSQILILAAFMFSFVLAMTAAFLAAPAIASDLETGIAAALLARPLRRTELVIGRWLGLTAVIAGYAAASGLLEIGAVALLTGHAPPQPLVAVAYLIGQAMVLLTTALLLSTRLPAIAAGAISVVLFGLSWMAGVFTGVARVLGAEALADVTAAARWLFPSDGLWRGVVYGLEPPAVILIAAGALGDEADANPFFAGAPPPLAFTLWSIAWIAAAVALAAWSLERREI
jgi:ABC-type transport system involved in multi-copper enzyme maturation permease subunit